MNTRVKFRSTKYYPHSTGLSCVFRQWRAKSHCNQLHGYALAVRITFEATELDENGWVVDFGGLKSFKEWLVHMFDHTTLIAEDDPKLDSYFQKAMTAVNIADIRIVKRTGCEAFAYLIFSYLEGWMQGNGMMPRAYVYEVEVSEHEGNSAIVQRNMP